GKAIAETLAAQGVKVLCVSKNPDSCGAVAAAITAAGGQAQAYAVDVADSAAVKAACEQILKDHERVDILINNAGITRDTLLLRMSDEDWHSVLNTNLSSCFYWTKALLQPMARARWGRIINISSVVGLMGNAGQANYAAAKAGMLGFTKSLARELAGRNITANAVAPGFITTDMTSKLSPELTEGVQKMIPLKRFGEAAEVAALTAYLASDQSAYVTGQVFTVDGGMAM
ncbi:MAG TPA: 3-oxoacyl-[acyl-carrier-protein] reductase, partial [Opitutales bacterium]|nr:3-oxoacyl-[acyl-carrier-protein] reductase [Opitutales bacterium]